MKSNNKKVNYKVQLSIAAALLGVGLVMTTQAVEAADSYSTAAKTQKRDTDPLLPGQNISNGYIDDGYTYLEPDLTSPEREEAYHMTTAQGWSNDLQTITYDESTKEYSLYYLHTAGGAGSATSAQNWDRVTTKDFIHFSKPTVAIKTGNDFTVNSTDEKAENWDSAWTGSVITNDGSIKGVPKGAKVAYFSGLSEKDNQQNIWAAYSDDGGKTFAHTLNNGKPVIDHYWGWTSSNRADERDPSIFYWS